jgi:hypothetical protein
MRALRIPGVLPVQLQPQPAITKNFSKKNLSSFCKNFEHRRRISVKRRNPLQSFLLWLPVGKMITSVFDINAIENNSLKRVKYFTACRQGSYNNADLDCPDCLKAVGSF